MAESTEFVDVAVNAPINSALTYLLGEHDIKLGQSVKVPLGRRTVSGVVVKLNTKPTDPSFKIKSITEVHPERPLLSSKYLELCHWLANYYIFPIGMILELAFPPLKKHSNRKTKYQVIPDSPQSTAPTLNAEQSQVVSDILQTINTYNTHLIHGVTGSGKTEVYLALIEHILTQTEKSVLFLVPEISLTPQLLQRTSARFPDQVAIIHSQLTAREKTNQWWAARENKKRILLGARSALFCPLENLGLIIVDEEHEPSFKQEDKLRYNGRDTAVILGTINDCPVILGSATPSLESFYNCKVNKYRYHKMEKRVHQDNMPTSDVINMQRRQSGEKDIQAVVSKENGELPFWLSPELHKKIELTLEKKKQTALFLNRRGIAQLVICPDCSFVYNCPNCEISLTLHQRRDLVCHYCNYTQEFKEICPQCESIEIKPMGMGTEKIERDIRQLFPNARTARADRDQIISRHELEKIIQGMENQEIDILIGTQMIAKGLDFKHLETVGLILADIGFNLPNFRANERSYQLITQVSGRAGRNSDSSGSVIIQAYNTEHPSVQHAINGNFESFSKEELSFRESLNYPPFAKIALVKLACSNQDALEKSILNLDSFNLKISKNETFKNLKILGPSPAPLFKIKNVFRYQMLLGSKQLGLIHHYYKFLIENKKHIFSSRVKVLIDIDPISML